MPKISIIIPVYNAEKYLRECLDSVINQTFKDIEIICIDDGSADNSFSILQSYAEKDDRIKLLRQENQGPSAARNLGLKNATGEYITFVDADDYVSEKMCEKAYEKAITTKVDIVLFSFFQFTSDKILLDDRLQQLSNNTPSVFDFLSVAEDFISLAPVETVGKFYKAEIIKNNNITFPENIRLGEDMCFYYSICMTNPTITIIPEAFYYYRINTENSLVKRPNAMYLLYELLLCLQKNFLNSKLKNEKEVFEYILKRMAAIATAFWNNCFTSHTKKQNFKYLNNIYIMYKKVSHEENDIFETIKKDVFEYRFYFLKKLLEPIIEIELREMRFVIYLFEKQILNIPNLKIRRIYYNFFYTLLLWKLRFVSKFRKIRVGFWVTEGSKWTNQHFYNKLKQDKKFEPFILLSYFKYPMGEFVPKEYYKELKETFEKEKTKIYEVFDADNYKFKDLLSFKPDIIFYQQPWMIYKTQHPNKTHKNALLCYIPYCFYSMNSYLNYLANFHGRMWKYFVETDLHKKEYEKYYSASNCVTAGSIKLDGYHFINKDNAESYWKTKGKKRIIYAPHHSFNDGLHEVATFKENGKFILELAKSHPETEWIFRPHPLFIDRITRNSIMTLKEVNSYYDEWRKIGQISRGGNYYELFSSSDVLITDCISFLAEYAPTLKPVIHLRKKNQKEDFNALVSKLDEGYYQIHSNEELKEVFEQVVINGKDYLKEKREDNKKLLPTDILASDSIYNYLKKTLWI